MDSQYGIAVTNKFCLFDDDDDVDPYEILKQEEQKRTEALAKEKADKSKPTKKSKKTAPQTDNKIKLTEQNTQKKEEKVVPSQARTQQNERPPRSARQNRENREPREDRRPRRPEENSSMTNEPRDKPEGGFGNRMESRGGFSGRPRGRGGPRGRGRGGFGGGGFGGKREFERHSGSDRTSGVKAMEKREGSGAHNWGTFKDDMDEEASKENEEPKESWNQGEDAENQDPNESAESTEQTVAEGDKTPKQLTLDEWKAQEEKKRLKTDFNLRKPNEGSDTSQLKGTAYKKPGNTSDDEEEEEDEEYEEEDDHKSKSQVPIRITFNDSPRRGGRRPRGGRGPRGSLGRGDRRGNSRDTAPRFDDEADFPSLVKSAA